MFNIQNKGLEEIRSHTSHPITYVTASSGYKYLVLHCYWYSIVFQYLSPGIALVLYCFQKSSCCSCLLPAHPVIFLSFKFSKFCGACEKFSHGPSVKCYLFLQTFVIRIILKEWRSTYGGFHTVQLYQFMFVFVRTQVCTLSIWFKASFICSKYLLSVDIQKKSSCWNNCFWLGIEISKY